MPLHFLAGAGGRGPSQGQDPGSPAAGNSLRLHGGSSGAFLRKQDLPEAEGQLEEGGEDGESGQALGWGERVGKS